MLDLGRQEKFSDEIRVNYFILYSVQCVRNFIYQLPIFQLMITQVQLGFEFARNLYFTLSTARDQNLNDGVLQILEVNQANQFQSVILYLSMPPHNNEIFLCCSVNGEIRKLNLLGIANPNNLNLQQAQIYWSMDSYETLQEYGSHKISDAFNLFYAELAQFMQNDNVPAKYLFHQLAIIRENRTIQQLQQQGEQQLREIFDNIFSEIFPGDDDSQIINE